MIIILLLLVALVTGVLGFVVKGALWLLVICGLALIGAGVFRFVKDSSDGPVRRR